MEQTKPMTAEQLYEFISLAKVNKSNIEHIAETGRINDTLLMSIRNICEEYKDSHIATLQSEIDRLNKEVERLKDYKNKCRKYIYALHDKIRNYESYIDSNQ